METACLNDEVSWKLLDNHIEFDRLSDRAQGPNAK